MRFVALFKKEFREILPWILLALSFFLFFGGLILLDRVLGQSRLERWYGNAESTPIEYYRLTGSSVLNGVGMLFFLVSLGLGVIIGVRQFWMPVFLGTWAYTLHRSSSRMSILLAKLAAAAAGFIVALGCPWTLVYWYASRPGVFVLPAGLRVFVEGWIFILMSLTLYFGMALSGLLVRRDGTEQRCSHWSLRSWHCVYPLWT